MREIITAGFTFRGLCKLKSWAEAMSNLLSSLDTSTALLNCMTYSGCVRVCSGSHTTDLGIRFDLQLASDMCSKAGCS